MRRGREPVDLELNQYGDNGVDGAHVLIAIRRYLGNDSLICVADKEIGMLEKSLNKSEETSRTTQPTSKKVYRKPVLIELGSLRELTLKKNSKGAADGKRNRFTGRGGRHAADS